jgi:hypothetical protein
MKNVGFTALSAMFLLSLVAPPQATAQTAGPSTSGFYRFIFDENDGIKSLDFAASTDLRGFTSGQMTLFDPSPIADVDDPEDPRAGDPPAEFYVKAELDTLKIEKNRALMSGTVRDSSHKTYIGRWVQLVVEDNGDNTRVPDQITWTLCKAREGGWVPADAERKDDDGAYRSWWATDAERRDDVGIPSVNLLGSSEEKSCPVYQLFSYSFIEPLKWDGDVVVVPAER